jgi:hypothetical protein
VLGGVHCGIYKGSYNVSNISYLNSLLPLLSFIPLLHKCYPNLQASNNSIISLHVEESSKQFLVMEFNLGMPHLNICYIYINPELIYSSINQW